MTSSVESRSSWKHTTWGDEISLEYGKPIKEYKDVTAPYKVYGSNGAIGFTHTPLVQGPGVILGRKGAYRGVRYSHQPFSVIDTAYYVKLKSPDLDMRWVYYSIIHNKLGEIDDGSPIPSTTRAAVYAHEMKVPPLNEQLEIAATLGALDDKIEANQWMNETLKAMAQATFRDWFVDFGPTRAKMEGRKPYLAPDIWSLFPDKLDNEGKPLGWEYKPLDEIADFLNGLALQKFPASDPDDSLPVIKIAELRNGITEKSNRASPDIPGEYIVQNGDFLFSWSGSLLAKFWTDGEGALNQHLFKVASDRYPAWFFSQWVYHHLHRFQMIAASKATTMGHIQRGHLKEAMTVCPPGEVLADLGLIVDPLVEQQLSNALEARAIAATRDSLLPRLMSGEIGLSETQNM